MNEMILPPEQPLTAVQIRKQVNLIQEVMNEVMKDGQHYGKIPGCGDKPTLLKPGAEKLSMVFRLRPVINNDRDIRVDHLEEGHREISVYCHILNMEGVELATGIGSCSTMETKYRYRGGERVGTGQPLPTEYWNLSKVGKKDEAQKLLGGPGFGPGKIDGVWQICQIGQKMENSDIADTYNTVLKMAKKRAYVDGILSATGASDIFTQDIEDMNLEPKAEPAKTSSKPAVEPSKETENAEGHAEPNPPAGNPNAITEPQRKRLYAIATKAGIEDLEQWLMFYHNIESSKVIQRSEYEKICMEATKYKKQ